MRCVTQARRRRTRPGFTLLELLIVIALLGILMSIAIGAVFRLRESQMKSFTETTIQKLASAFDQQFKAAMDQMKEDAPPNPAGGSIGNLAGKDIRRARVIYNKLRLRADFPTTFAMALLPSAGFADNPVPPKATFTAALNGVNATGVPEDVQAGILLYLSLGQARKGMAAFRVDELVEPSAIGQIDLPVGTAGQTKSFRYFKDSWDIPIRHYIFPTGNDELNQPPYVELVNMADTSAANQTKLQRMKARDPQDPEGTLYAPSWAALRTQFVSLIHPLPNRGTEAFPAASHLIPVIASAGPDKAFGFEPTLPGLMVEAPGGAAHDNIYSYRLRRAGARGD